MEHTDQPRDTRGEAPEDDRRNDEERPGEDRPDEAEREDAAEKAPMKPGSAGAASRGSGPARAGS